MEREPVSPERKLDQKTKELLDKLGETATKNFPKEIQPDRTERFDRFDRMKLLRPDDIDR
ncbi:MAG TPA: hypothetical protein VH144_01225 [Candidatus Saccharimonadales bacterium]|jgi:hypothetical protein|nr:hypothetical protein [Candidatus Saccharimonadales bacterium]